VSVAGSSAAIFQVRTTWRPETSCTDADAFAERSLAGLAAAGATARIESAAAITATVATRPIALGTCVVRLVMVQPSSGRGAGPIARQRFLPRVRVRAF